MMDAARIGFSTPAQTVRIEGWHVRLFCQAIGETEVPGEGEPVPPTFLKALEVSVQGSAAILQALGQPLTGVLHAEQAFEHHAPVRVGDEVTLQRTLRGVESRKDGALTFVTLETAYRIGDRHVASSCQTVVLRRQDAAA